MLFLFQWQRRIPPFLKYYLLNSSRQFFCSNVNKNFIQIEELQANKFEINVALETSEEEIEKINMSPFVYV